MNLEFDPDISVCIANYNGGEFVLECLESVRRQEGDFTIEIIVHDDASTDDSANSIERLFPEALLLRSTKNSGFCVSNNRMASAARGRYVLLLNNDAILHDGSLQAFFSSAEGGLQDCILGLPQRSLADNLIVDHGYRIDPFLNPIPILTQDTHEVGVATGACLWIPKKIWGDVGGFPEWFESIAEDIFLCMAARLLGYRVVVLATPCFDHWIGKNLGGGKLVGSTLQSTVRRRTLSERNKIFVMLCCYPWPVITALMPLHAVSLLLEATFLLLVGTKPSAVWRIYASIPGAMWRCRGNACALRERLMRQKQVDSNGLFAFTDWLPHKLRMLLRHGIPNLD
ncbi:glycosyltransferase family 2 protein [Solilutibacter silvestris]|uniref:glycosyltransferase family 2 protein n=1 Tax=Solilutibacter silvestris TaxID=1645665 RepID=UPI003D34FDD1